MLTRIISGAVLTLIIGSGLIIGGPYLFILLLAISIMGIFEIYRVYKIEKSVIGVLGYIFAIAYYVCLWFAKDNFMMLSITSALICIMGGYVFAYPKYNAGQTAVGFFAIVYVAVMLSFIYMIRIFENGVYLVWLVFICSWIADTFAYFTGTIFNKLKGTHKMTPVLSPKKSYEGAVGGIVGAMIVGGIYGLAINSKFAINAPLVFAVACGFGAFISMIGDLAASGIKRDHGVKDYSKLIPGHGGIMDRFDSTIFTAPAIYLVLALLGAIG